MYSHLGKSWAVSCKIKHPPTTQLRNLTPRYVPKRNENACSHKTCMWMFENCLICHCQKLENLKLLQLAKKKLSHIHYGKLVSNKKEWIEINSCIYGQLIFNMGAKTTQWGKDNLFNKWLKTGYPHVKDWS